MNALHRITLDLPAPDLTCDVLVGEGLLANVGNLAHDLAPHDRAALVVDERLADSHGEVVRAALESAGFKVAVITMPADEGHKTARTLQRLWREFLDARLDRKSPVVAVGGGVVGDTAGFAAATFMRGLPWINVPTTLLSMVDASVGGKTGINLPIADDSELLGKNLVGAFWQPRAVVADVATLKTLEIRHVRAGLAECVKHAILADEPLFERLTAVGGRLMEAPAPELAAIVARNVEIKAEIVHRDEREAGPRMLLNLGHTFAHAIETRHELGLTHGEAVAIGLVAAAAAGESMGITQPGVRGRIQRLLESIGLKTRVPLPEPERMRDLMALDKKSERGRMRLIVPATIGRVEIIHDAPESAVSAGWRAVGA